MKLEDIVRSVILFTEGLVYSTLFESDKVDFHEIIALSPYKICCGLKKFSNGVGHLCGTAIEVYLNWGNF